MAPQVRLIQIDLERPSGIFYAGEVVRGTVRLQTSGVQGQQQQPQPQDGIACHGFELQFAGLSHVHWHTGSGDDRNDYDGTTTFQYQRQVLYGDYHKTGLLDNAGADAYFDKVPFLGVVHIPCDAAEEYRLNMVVRIMDYDWGKRDDLLGEALVDVPALARSGSIQSFPLTRNGKPEKGEVSLSAKWLPYDAVFPTQGQGPMGNPLLVSAVVRKQFCLILRVHQATGLRKADWAGKNDVYVQMYKLIGENLPGHALPPPDKKVVLPAFDQQDLIVPFAFRIRNDAPGSAEFPYVGDRCYVRYTLRANVDFRMWRDPSSLRIITVLAHRPLPSLNLLAPCLKDGPMEPLYGYQCCCFSCCKLKGMVSAKLSLGRLAYAPGERVDLTGSVVTNETSSNDLVANVTLKCFIVCRTPANSSHWQTLRYPLLTTKVRANEILRLDSLPDITNIVIPPVYPSFYGGIQPPFTWTFYPCLKWAYTIELSIGGTGSFNSAVATDLPVLISAAPPYDEAVEQARFLRPNLILPDPWSIFEHAIVGDDVKNYTLAPTITGPEDGGCPSATGDGLVNVAGIHDNQYVGDTAHLQYQPVVNTFNWHNDDAGANSPYGTFSSPTAADGFQSSSQVDTSSPYVPVSSSSPNALDKLLEDMENSYDKREAVGKWVRKYPTQASQLSPQDFEKILSKVTFSLDQPVVVGELIAAFSRSDRLTCSHIVAAMEVCKYQKTEIAEMMAPHVCDPENKEIVLKQIDYSFEKDAVSKVFR